MKEHGKRIGLWVIACGLICSVAVLAQATPKSKTATKPAMETKSKTNPKGCVVTAVNGGEAAKLVHELTYKGSMRLAIEAGRRAQYKAWIQKKGGPRLALDEKRRFYRPGNYSLTVECRQGRETNTKRYEFTIKKYVLAVLDLAAGENVSKQQALTVTSLLRKHLLGMKVFALVDQEMMNDTMRVLNRERATAAATGCTGVSCDAEIAKRLDADIAIVGRLDVKDGRYVVSLAGTTGEGKRTLEESTTLPAGPLSGAGSLQLAKKVASRLLDLDKSILDSRELRSFLWRSVVFPGWGQWYEAGETGKRKRAARIFLYSGVGLSALTLFRYREFKAAQRDYDSTVGVPAGGSLGHTLLLNMWLLQDKKDRLDRAEKQMTQGFYLLAAVWAANIVHITFYPDVGTSVSISAGVSPGVFERPWQVTATAALTVRLNL